MCERLGEYGQLVSRCDVLGDQVDLRNKHRLDEQHDHLQDVHVLTSASVDIGHASPVLGLLGNGY